MERLCLLRRAAPLPADEREDLSFVWEAVKALPVPYQEVIHRFYYVGYFTAQIAKILHQKESTVRSNLRYGRIKLREFLREEYGFEEISTGHEPFGINRDARAHSDASVRSGRTLSVAACLVVLLADILALPGHSSDSPDILAASTQHMGLEQLQRTCRKSIHLRNLQRQQTNILLCGKKL